MEVTAVKIPPYNFSDPQLWFSTCERTFALGVPKAITDTCTKFNYIVASLPPEAAAIVRDLIITPDETDPYGAIKAQLIQRTGESSQQEIRKLLTVLLLMEELEYDIGYFLFSLTPDCTLFMVCFSIAPLSPLICPSGPASEPRHFLWGDKFAPDLH
ncbi:transposon Tf2-9 polyprotein [Trichonephila inaurata madagascariensis]|uniref:Transposon Tf2-9 polyprotein n=1 Tax=Trichonephila inaurata madagascariensis TaxID=2747483 RepID=A0A8X6WWE2_9ARAC|nr:transposon Tf2-9 polyprotein [Trichonephila inaurata madagascariensis]